MPPALHSIYFNILDRNDRCGRRRNREKEEIRFYHLLCIAVTYVAANIFYFRKYIP